MPLDKGLAFELDRMSDMIATPDHVEGMEAFVEKRRPVFTGEEPRPARATKRKTKQ